MTASLDLFDRFGPALRAELSGHCAQRHWRKGEIVALAGDRKGEALFVTSGQFKVTLGSLDGRELLIAIRGRGEVVGELSLLDGGVRSATLTALAATQAWSMPGARFTALLDGHVDFARALHVDTVTKLRSATNRQIELGYDTVAGRVSRRLVDLASRFCDSWPDAQSSGGGAADGSLPESSVSFSSPITQQELADWSGVTRQAVVKELTSLRDSGVISTTGSTFTVHDAAALVEMSRQLLG